MTRSDFLSLERTALPTKVPAVIHLIPVFSILRSDDATHGRYFLFFRRPLPLQADAATRAVFFLLETLSFFGQRLLSTLDPPFIAIR